LDHVVVSYLLYFVLYLTSWCRRTADTIERAAAPWWGSRPSAYADQMSAEGCQLETLLGSTAAKKGIFLLVSNFKHVL